MKDNTTVDTMKPTIMKYVGEIRLRMGNIAKSILEIGELYVEASRKYSNYKKVFAKEFPNVRESTWEKFKLIGEHKLSASAFFLSDTLSGHFVRAKIPVKVQEKQISTMGVIVYRRAEKKAVVVPFSKFTEEDEKAFFDVKHEKIRTVAEQKKYVESGFKEEKEKAWKVVDGGLMVRRACFIPWTEIKDLDIFKGGV